MIKVVQVLSDTNVGGAGRYLLNYLKYFDRSKFETEVIIPEGSMLKRHIEAFDDVKILEAPHMADKTFDKKCVKFLKEHFKSTNPDIIHTHASLSARVAARKAKTGAIISTRHCIEPPGTGAARKVKSVLNKNLCDIYIAVADAVKQNLLDSGIPEKMIRVIYNGVDEIGSISPEERAALRKSLGAGEGDVLFGVFARLEPVKGHKYFLKAAREVIKEKKNARFIIVGDGSLMGDLKERTKKYNLDDRVVFTGYVEDTAPLLNAVDVNVISSESEAMSLAILEAMSLEKPNIATDAGGNSQLISSGVTGLLAAPCDSSSLCEAMIKMIDDSEFRESCARLARAEYKEKFTAEKMVKNLENLYLELVR